MLLNESHLQTDNFTEDFYFQISIESITMETATKDEYVCLLISLLWCDIINFLSGFVWLFLAFSRYNDDPMLKFGAIALILVNLISLLFTCCGKYLNKGISWDCYWFRVFMLPGRWIIFPPN